MLKKVIFGLLLFCLLVMPTSAFERINFGNGFVADNANTLRRRDKALMNVYLWDLHKKTTADIAVVILNSLAGQRVEATAMYINKAFKVGALGKDNGIVFVIVPSANKIAIDTGCGIDPAIPSLRKQQIINEIMMPSIEKGDWSKAIYDGLVVLTIDTGNYYNTKITGLEYTSVPPMPKTLWQKIAPVNWLIAILLLISGVILFFISKKPKSFDCNEGFNGAFNPDSDW